MVKKRGTRVQVNRNGGLQLLACAVDPQLRSCSGCTVAINGQAVFCIVWSRAVQEDELYECESVCVDVHSLYMHLAGDELLNYGMPSG